ncbi:hypothetical protein FTO74_14730 [Granulicella sp. WH15]|uniref:hypothetical protein n=1 Tax=Granulicella sp. WH15 TaxID=2602070 RepID=UPI0013675AA0|nr:hypothetical protein [Granulicella sp. WH15]QHN04478.1 hypothetical protein FTO74_14730 [Granulicella sp. WH15]
MKLFLRRAFLFVLTGCTFLAKAQGQTTPGKPSTDGIRCSRFEWNAGKSVMRVPITVNGQHYWYQLDTGADVVIPYGAKEHAGWTEKSSFTRAPRVQFAGMFFSSIPVYRMKNIPDKDLQGSVGLDILVGHTFVIDFPRQRICLMNRADLPDALNRAADWIPAQIRDGKLFLSAELNGQKLPDLIYDSGDSPDELSVDFDLWKAATNLKGAEDTATHQVDQIWGKEVESVTAKSTGDLRLGQHTYSHPVLSTTPSRPNFFRDNVFGASGSLGNALFFSSIVILDLGSHPQFGVVSPSSTEH